MFSKVVETLVYNRLIKYIDLNNILYDKQFGFRKAQSTELALTLLNDKLTRDRGKSCIGIFLDFSKLFSRDNHEILSRKLQHYGIRRTPLKWFVNYIADRSQYVHYKQTSSRRNISYHLFLDPRCSKFTLMNYHMYLINKCSFLVKF